MKKIAVAEDDLTLREGLLSLLAGSGYEVYAVKNFQNAAAEILKSGADLVLLDILLPGANGQEILRALRKESQIPVSPIGPARSQASVRVMTNCRSRKITRLERPIPTA